MDNSFFFLETTLSFPVNKPVLLLHPRKTQWFPSSKADMISKELPFLHQNHQPLLTKNIHWKFILQCLKKELVFHTCSDTSMHPFTGDYPKTEQESQECWNKYTHLSWMNMNTMNTSGLLFVVTAQYHRNCTGSSTIDCLDPWCFTAMLPPLKKPLWNSIFCWVLPSPPPSKTTSAELPHSSH